MEEEIKKEESQEEKKEEQAVPEKPLDKMTVIELREFSLNKNLGISGVHAMKKEELLPAVKEALGIKDEEPAKKGVEVKATVGEMKTKDPSTEGREADGHFVKGQEKNQCPAPQDQPTQETKQESCKGVTRILFMKQAQGTGDPGPVFVFAYFPNPSLL